MFSILIILQIDASGPGNIPDTFYKEMDPDSRMYTHKFFFVNII